MIYPCACVLRWDALPDGRRVQTVDLFASYMGYRDVQRIDELMGRNWGRSMRDSAIDLCNSLGRYETIVGDDYDRLYRARTWQQAWDMHDALLVAHAA